MKVIPIILALLVTVLSVMPCCISENCEIDSIKTEHTDDHSPKAELCSPFYSCSACIGFTLLNCFLDPANFQLNLKPQFAEYKPNSFPQIYLSFWQPPKLT
ncbi:DUF6660 family protein [Pontibacter sp. 13R65]|uniref:DUF6660 family protein n=1 Tax=Pontibacter sp. 13R65 TaxID=3127458 RepID=UPI0039C956D8